MKPTSAMFNRLRARPQASEAEAPPPAPMGPQAKPPQAKPPQGETPQEQKPSSATAPAEVPATPGEPPERQKVRDVLEALGRVTSEQERAALEEELKKLDAELPESRRQRRGSVGDVGRVIEEVVLAPRTPATPGFVAVRVLGLDTGEEKVPLEGLRVRATAGEKQAEGATDESGQALLFLDAVGAFDVEILSSKGEVLERATGRLASGQAASVEVAAKKRPELEEHFARGRTWLEALRSRAERIPSIQPRDTQALERRIATLEATVERLERTLAKLTKAEPQDTKGGAQ